MKRIFFSVLLLLFALSLTYAAPTQKTQRSNELTTANYYKKIRSENDIAKMTLFFSQMPKGGDIHHHYSGAVYSETYIDWAGTKGYRLNTQTLKLDTQSAAPYITIDSLKKNDSLYRAVLETWSCMDFYNHFRIHVAPDRHFFNTFNYFGTISSAYINNELQQLKARAILENVQYIETMLVSPSFSEKYKFDAAGLMLDAQSRHDTARLFRVLDSCASIIVADPKYEPYLHSYMDSLYKYHTAIDDSLFLMRFQAYASRNSQPDIVFTKLFTGFNSVAADSARLLTGMNIVGPENGLIALRDYWLHMQMFCWLKKRFSGVRASMHAGELSMGMVEPENLAFHITQAVNVAHADRIGHGVDIVYEKDAPALLTIMRNKIPVEINLTSNEFILGVRGPAHPVRIYFENNVPVVISTDDAGVSRNSLTDEYVKLGSRYNFSYEEIKGIVYNSIRYSFLSEADKQLAKKLLDIKFAAFEHIAASVR